MKKITLFLLAFILNLSVFAQATFTQNTDMIVTGTNSVGCPNGDNEWARNFVLSDFSVDNTASFTISSGEFGVQTTDATGTTITVSVYASDASFPASFDPANILGTQDILISEFALEEIISFTFDTPIIVPTGTEALTYTVSTAAGNNFFIGGTADETAEGHLRSTTCGVANFTTPNTINFPDAHFYMTLTSSDATLGVDENVFAKNISVFPNPTQGDLSVSFSKNYGATAVEITSVNGQRLMSTTLDGFGDGVIKTNDLASGIYFAQLSNKEGSTIVKFIKN